MASEKEVFNYNIFLFNDFKHETTIPNVFPLLFNIIISFMDPRISLIDRAYCKNLDMIFYKY